jgi:hypothetical protein
MNGKEKKKIFKVISGQGNSFPMYEGVPKFFWTES